MASVNKVILIGNLGQDPSVRFMPNGDQVTTLSLATTDSWKDKNGEKQERTEWHRIVLYRKLAEIAGQYLKKGRPAYIEGRLQTKEYTDKEGIKRYITQVVAETLKMLGSKPGEPEQNASPQTPASAGSASNDGFDDMDDNIPF